MYWLSWICVFALFWMPVITEAQSYGMQSILDPYAQLATLAESGIQFAHEAPVYLPSLDSVFFVSNRLFANGSSVNGKSTLPQFIRLYLLNLASGAVTELHPTPEILMANGAIPAGGDEIIIISQGSGETGGGLIRYNVATGANSIVINSVNGTQFNSPNDLIYSQQYQGYFFTDPTYGFTQGFRPDPKLPPSVYYYNPSKNVIIRLLDSMVKPNGIALSPDGRKLYVSDTGFFVDGPTTDPTAPRAVFTYAITKDSQGLPVLSDKKTLASFDSGAPDGIKLDNKGNVYIGIGGGVAIYGPDDKELGLIKTPSGVANLVFAGNKLIMLGEDKVYAIDLKVAGAEFDQPPV